MNRNTATVVKVRDSRGEYYIVTTCFGPVAVETLGEAWAEVGASLAQYHPCFKVTITQFEPGPEPGVNHAGE